MGGRGLTIGLIASAIWQNPPQQPTFRSGTDVVVVDARVLDRGGKPVLGLGTADFQIKVDGSPRRVVAVAYESAARVLTRSGAASAAADPLADAGGQASALMVVVDRYNLRTATSRETLDGAAAFVERLPTSHSVGLMNLPDGAGDVKLGGSRAAVAWGLRRILGNYQPGMATPGDTGRTRVALHTIIGDLSKLDGRRSVLYLADRLEGGFVIDEIADRAALSGVAFYVVVSDPPVISADTSGPARNPAADYDGLSALAVASGGLFLRRFAGAGAIFDRIEHELDGQYLLTFETTPSDQGKHGISVAVNRAGVDVRARRQFVK